MEEGSYINYRAARSRSGSNSMAMTISLLAKCIYNCDALRDLYHYQLQYNYIFIYRYIVVNKEIERMRDE